MKALQPLRTTLGRIVHRSSLPYTSLPLLPSGASLSDQFLYRGDLAGHRFVAENTLALLSGEPVPVTHTLTFFDADGRFLAHQDHASTRLFAAIDVGDPGAELASYIHTSRYAPEVLRELAARRPELGNLRRLHRGYALYRRTEHSVYAAVHGNVGGIRLAGDGRTGRTRHLARRRRTFLYTPQHRFAERERVMLCFINPCTSQETITLFGGEGRVETPPVLAELSLPPRGTRCFRIQGFAGYLSLRSRLPMCRPLVFIEDPAHPDHLDVFHT